MLYNGTGGFVVFLRIVQGLEVIGRGCHKFSVLPGSLLMCYQLSHELGSGCLWFRGLAALYSAVQCWRSKPLHPKT